MPSTGFLLQEKELSEDEILEIRKRIVNTKVEVKAELGSTVVKVNEILNLQIGDVIRLNDKGR